MAHYYEGRTEYTVRVETPDGQDWASVYKFDSLSEAIRTWDLLIHAHAAVSTPVGGIQRTFTDYQGKILADGWILQVRDDGTVYLNPNLQEVPSWKS